MEYEITEQMLEDHRNIDLLLDEFIENPTKNTLQKLKWNLERHFLLEEKAIFVFSPDAQTVHALKTQHQAVLDEIKLLTANQTTPGKLKTMLKKHSKFEDESFYPKLDKHLTETQKQEMIEKITLILV
tara:strand:- start:757 stop:1140 length:384 start_codon:yes stop_codon:yes gene_type:complete